MSLAWKQTRITSSIDSSSIHGLVVTAAVALAITKMMRLTFKSSGSSRANDGGDDYEQRIISGDCPTKSHRPLLGGRGLVSREMSLPFVVVVVAVLVCLATTPLASGQLYEGSSCTTRNGTLGLCKIHRHCVWAMDGYRARTFTISDMVRCGFQGREELICCLDEMPDQGTTEPTDNFVFDSTSTAPTPAPSRATIPPIRLQDRRSLVECNRFVRDYSVLTYHILGGEETNLGDFPHMAALGYPSDEGVSWKCGGALVAENYVLTAAHCLTREQPNVVRLGQVDLQANLGDSGGQDVPVQSIIMHPDYVPRFNYHDVALLRLASNVSMSDTIYPACLRASVADVPNESLLVTGWGDTSVQQRQRSNVLLKTNLTVVDLSSCNQTYTELPADRRLPNILNQGQLCAFDPRGINDACQGDSGGPLQIIMPNNFASVVGITSFGTSCGTAIPSVYARVAFYLDWLESVIWPN